MSGRFNCSCYMCSHSWKHDSQKLVEDGGAKCPSCGLWLPVAENAKDRIEIVSAVERVGGGPIIRGQDFVNAIQSIDFLKAAENGNTEIVKSLLNANVDINAKNSDGMTALFKAAQNGHADIVKLLLEVKADVNVKETIHGLTAFMIAAVFGHANIVKLLLQSKTVDVNAKDNDGMTTLLMAAYYGNTEVVKILLEANADVNCTTTDGRSLTPLFCAVHARHIDIITLLLEAGANVNVKASADGAEETPLSIAMKYGLADVMRLLKGYGGKE